MTTRTKMFSSIMDRRTLLRGTAVGLGALMSGTPVRAQDTIASQGGGRTTIGEIRPIPIAVPEFIGADRKLGTEMANVVLADLESSGLFKAINREAYLEQINNVDTAPNYVNWQQIGAEALVVGAINQGPDGRLQVTMRVWDVVTKKALAGNRFAAVAANWRRISHQVADVTYEKLSGNGKYFDTRIVFIDETGSKQKRLKRLAIMDQDGANVRLLTKGSELVLTPRFSPTSQEITYVSYQNEQPRVVLMNIETNTREVVGNFPGMTFAPRFSPDGQRLVMSLGTDGNSGLVEFDLRSKQTRQLTEGAGISTGPCYAPNGAEIVFESDRDKSQQLYIMGAGGVRRLSRGEGRYSTPVWSPRGDYIAFTKQMSGRFLIGVVKPDGSGERILTEGYHNEGPTWAPNGRVLMFFREGQGANGGPKLHSVDITGYNERQIPTPAFGSDPAWSPLLG
jgi:TolB protein